MPFSDVGKPYPKYIHMIVILRCWRIIAILERELNNYRYHEDILGIFQLFDKHNIVIYFQLSCVFVELREEKEAELVHAMESQTTR